MIKKFFSKPLLLVACFIVLVFLVACRNTRAAGEISVMLVDGAPLINMVYLMSHEFDGIVGTGISFTMTNDLDAIVAALLNQEPDFAIVPINIAAMMHNNGSGYRMAAVTTWGIMHIVSDQDVSSLEDLIGETIIAFGRSGTPGITLRATLRQNGVPFTEHDTTSFTPDENSVNILYLTAASDVRDAIATGMIIGGTSVHFGLLAEPVATAITGFAGNTGRPGFTARINLQTEWARNNDGEIYPQTALVFHERLLESNPGIVSDFIAAAERASAFANNDPVAAGNLAAEFGSIAIPNGTIVGNAHRAGRLPMDFTPAQDAIPAVTAFLQAIHGENPALIGGRMPTDTFFHVTE